MADSCTSGLLRFHLSPDLFPARTPGSLGKNDAGDPQVLAFVGDTPGPCGRGDFAEALADRGTRYRLTLQWPWDDSSEADKAEFDRLKSKIADARGKVFKDAAAYVKYRNAYFGSAAAYVSFAAESDTELEEQKGLRKLIEFDKKGQEEAQKVFYRWVRKALLKRDATTDVPKLIKAGMTPKLVTSLQKVRMSYKDKTGKTFKAGGFNPRPIKYKGRYKLGTISDHALGTAADIDDKTNPQLPLEDWSFLQEFVGKKVDRNAARWRKEPEALWKDLKELNDLFVKKLKTELKRVEEQQAKEIAAEGAGVPKKRREKPTEVVWKAHPAHPGCAIRSYADGFLTLSWELVKEFHELDFLWGATFSNNVDLHHFQL